MKNILISFRIKLNEKFLIDIKEKIIEYIKIVKSKEEAQKILLKYNIKVITDNEFSEQEKKYLKLIKQLKNKNLEIPNDWYNIEITEQDIIDRINEIKIKEIKWIRKNRFIYDEYYYENINIDKNYDSKMMLKIYEVSRFYNEIIEKEFYSKTKEKELKK